MNLENQILSCYALLSVLPRQEARDLILVLVVFSETEILARYWIMKKIFPCQSVSFHCFAKIILPIFPPHIMFANIEKGLTGRRKSRGVDLDSLNPDPAFQVNPDLDTDPGF